MKRKASASWTGKIIEGQGTLSTQSGTLSETPYSFGMRFKDDPGTNPEELIGAAHAGCFSMAFSGNLERAGMTPERISTEATVTIEKQGDGFAITAVHLDVVGRVPGAAVEDFLRVAEESKNGCPVSMVLNAEITMKARLES
jgi:osmotically inducible protein OsmC